MGWVPIFLFSIDVSFPIQKFYFQIWNWCFLYKVVNLIILILKSFIINFVPWSIQVEEKLMFLQLLKLNKFLNVRMLLGSLYTKTKLVILQPLSLLPLTKKMLDKIFFKNFFIRLKVHLQNFLLNLRPSSQISYSFFIFVNWNEMAHVFTAFEN